MFKRIILMIQFLTQIPIAINLDVNEEDFGKGLAFGPLIGLLIGGFIALIYRVSSMAAHGLFPAAVVMVCYAMMTGGLHIDGLGDTFDGLFSNRSKERMLEIMRDSRVGTNAVIAIVSIFLLNTVCIAELGKDVIVKVLLIMPVMGRLGSVCSAGMSKYARSGEGLGKAFIDYCGINQIVIGTLISGIIAFLLFNLTGLIFIGSTIIFTYLFVQFVTSKIGGMTGDTCGAACELNQTIFLTLALILF
ncbi:adenosylcobinamide-GDP ribazoletransferase [Petroclostridium sp. X23]|uniref:adenosylcobinamide-GDP ribazoletransferase n=1 Tax=Petroclostridium sp. X23 TaxID=3045146 RepID=UPI0024ADA675|nr:adenosylcobinamide-GDP ribazoletransferase [Petroclostridium sp. X23]WHH60580.1 adenosylcobinamide-GDP ribazoletransferase [Petroclostridium sp. X23]